MKRKFVIATVVAAALVGGGTATAVATGDSQDETPDLSAPIVTEEKGDDADDADDSDAKDGDEDAGRAGDERSGKGGGSGSLGVTAPQAAKAALSSVSGTVTEIELDDDDDDGQRDLVWEVDVLGKNKNSDGARTWYDVTVDADSGKVLNVHKDRGDQHHGRHHDHGDDHGERHYHDGRYYGQQKVLAKLSGTSVDAAEAAKKAAAKGTVTSVDLEGDSGNAEWEIDVVGEDGTEYELTVDADSGKLTQQSADRDDQSDDDDDDNDNDDGDDDGDDD